MLKRSSWLLRGLPRGLQSGLRSRIPRGLPSGLTSQAMGDLAVCNPRALQVNLKGTPRNAALTYPVRTDNNEFLRKPVQMEGAVTEVPRRSWEMPRRRSHRLPGLLDGNKRRRDFFSGRGCIDFTRTFAGWHFLENCRVLRDAFSKNAECYATQSATTS